MKNGILIAILIFFEAFGRYAVKLIFGIFSLVFMFVTRKHQALHDMFANSVVIIRHPSKMPRHYLRTERPIEEEGYSYPSPLRRIIIIILYNLVFLALALVATFAVLSKDCIFNRSHCSPGERTIDSILNIGLFVVFGISLVAGWRGKLFGCRRKLLPKTQGYHAPSRGVGQ